MDKRWRTFICYRKNDKYPDGLLRYSSLLANIIYEHIKDKKLFSPVLYQERYYGGDFSFIEDIKDVMSDVAIFMPIITPDFFKTVIEHNKKIYEQPFDESVFKDQISFLEIALGICNQSFIYPIYIVDSNNEEFFEEKGKLENVVAMLRIAAQYLSGKYGFQLKDLDYDKFIYSFFTRTNPIVISVEEIKKMMDDNNKEGQELKAKYMNAIDDIRFPDVPFNHEEFKNNLLMDLARIHQVIQYNGHDLSYNNNIMDTNAYKRFKLSSNAKYYCISSAFIYGVSYLKDNQIVDNEPLPEGAGRGFVDVKNDCYSTSEDKNYYYWPLNLSTDRKRAENPSFFNVCAISFGAMMLNNWLLYDRKLYSNKKIGKGFKAHTEKEVRVEIAQSINLLLSLRDYYNMSWLSKWDFGLKLGAEAGTINQTTLSISTLITCGFLDRMDDETDNNTLYNRIKFIDSSLQWLEKKKSKSNLVKGNEAYYWGDGYSEKINVSLSLFCLDVYMKYYEKIVAVYNYDDIGDPPCLRGIPSYSTYCYDIRNNINAIVRGINAEIAEYIKSNSMTEHDNSTNEHDDRATEHEILLIYSKLLKSYSAYISLERKNGNIPDEITDKTRGIPTVYIDAYNLAKDALIYLYNHKDLVKCFTQENCRMLIEKFPYITDKQAPQSMKKKTKENDEYDNCAELLFIDAIIKAAEIGIYKQTNIQFSELLTVIESSIQWFQDDKTKIEDSIYIRIKGHNKLLAPIYAYYYYRMVIYDYIRLIEKDDAQ